MISFSLDRASVRETKRIIREYERKVGQTANESIVDIGREAARQAAQKCPPFGLSDKIGEKFKKSIAKQVNRAVKNANVTGKSGGAAKVHANSRDSKGQVPRGLRDKGQFKRQPVDIGDKERVIAQRQKAAGILKGAWIHAGTLLGRKVAAINGRRRHATRRRSTRSTSSWRLSSSSGRRWRWRASH